MKLKYWNKECMVQILNKKLNESMLIILFLHVWIKKIYDQFGI